MISLRRSSTDRLGAARQSDRTAVLLGLIAVTAAAWIYLLLGAGIAMDEMDMGDGSVMVMMPAWTPTYAALVLLLWPVLMPALTLPSAPSPILNPPTLPPHQPD